MGTIKDTVTSTNAGNSAIAGLATAIQQGAAVGGLSKLVTPPKK